MLSSPNRQLRKNLGEHLAEDFRDLPPSRFIRELEVLRLPRAAEPGWSADLPCPVHVLQLGGFPGSLLGRNGMRPWSPKRCAVGSQRCAEPAPLWRARKWKSQEPRSASAVSFGSRGVAPGDPSRQDTVAGTSPRNLRRLPGAPRRRSPELSGSPRGGNRATVLLGGRRRSPVTPLARRMARRSSSSSPRDENDRDLSRREPLSLRRGAPEPIRLEATAADLGSRVEPFGSRWQRLGF
jgi:hypothetical protein